MLGRIAGFLLRWFNPPRFIIVIENGTPRTTRGAVNARFLNDCSDIARDDGLQAGKIYGIKGRYGVALRFSGDIPAPAQQKFRNSWGLYR